MRLSWLLTIPTVFAAAIEKRDAEFDQVRTKMNKDASGRRGDESGKYFHESIFHPHYDGRFADRQLSYQQRRKALSNLMQTYLSTMSDLGVETWLMHGTLLGWWWNRHIMPWDSDSDVQMSESSMHYVANYYNMSVFHYKTPRIPDGRDYMLEVNPHYIISDQSDRKNVIDARWIDTTSGLFIDITTARYNLTHPAGAGMISCKDGHEYRDTYIFPLRDTYFEGVPAKIPYAYKELLEAEYKPIALTNKKFEGHEFDDSKMEWIPVRRPFAMPQALPAIAVKDPNAQKLDFKDIKPSPQANPWPPTPQLQTGSQPQSQPQSQPPVGNLPPSPAHPPSERPPPSSAQAQALMKEPPVVIPPKQEVKRTPEPPQPPPSVQKFEAKAEALAAKREAVLEITENKRKLAEEKAIAKEEKKIEKIVKEEQKRAVKVEDRGQKNLI